MILYQCKFLGTDNYIDYQIISWLHKFLTFEKGSIYLLSILSIDSPLCESKITSKQKVKEKIMSKICSMMSNFI